MNKMTQKIIQQGAEAKIILTKLPKQYSPLKKQSLFSQTIKCVIKDRIPKSYRIKELDDKIRKQRTKAEAKLLRKAHEIINSPKPIIEINNVDSQITMPYINGKKLSDHLDSFPLAKQKQIMQQLGKDIATLHNADLIHGDLTTSNMILADNNSEPGSDNNLLSGREGRGMEEDRNLNLKIFIIDFGLGYHSKKIEDKAVDIHLLKQALEAKHFKNWETLFKEFSKTYKDKKVLDQLTKVEKRGRYKH